MARKFKTTDYESVLQQRITLAEAQVILEACAQERYEAEKEEYEAKQSGRKPRGPQPKPPEAGPRDKDQYNFTDPDELEIGMPMQAVLKPKARRTGSILDIEYFKPVK